MNLMLMSSSPGVLDGDETTFVVDIATNASLKLETQSYQRIYQMKTGASQSITVNMQAGSLFSYIPFPLVPHKASIFTSRNKIFLSNHCTLQWGEVISCGRKLNNEVFQFTSVSKPDACSSRCVGASNGISNRSFS